MKLFLKNKFQFSKLQGDIDFNYNHLKLNEA